MTDSVQLTEGGNMLIDQFCVDVTVTSLAAARALWWQKHTVTSGVNLKHFNKVLPFVVMGLFKDLFCISLLCRV